MTHLRIKALRHYHEVGVLVPAAVDPSSGYRSYDLDQVSVAHVIRRFRDLGMPVEEVRAVLSAPDVASRTDLVTKHLARMHSQLLRTESVVSSLRSLLDSAPATIPVKHRSVPATLALAIAEAVAAADLDQWLGDAFDEIRSTLRCAGVEPSGPDGALYPAEYFQLEVAELVAFTPVAQPVTGTRRHDVPARVRRCRPRGVSRRDRPDLRGAGRARCAAGAGDRGTHP